MKFTMALSKPVVLIPAYLPEVALLKLVSALRSKNFDAIIVVDDGNGASHAEYFKSITVLGAIVLHHAVNLGKGAALKTGLHYSAYFYSDRPGVVTADADGQHTPEDISQVAQALEMRQDSLILGTRSFKGAVPLRSLIGNRITSFFFWCLTGISLGDTQTGLRGIPFSFIPQILKIRTNGFDFELDMLLLAKKQHVEIEKRDVSTVYIEQNRSSHFNPVLDSLRIYFVFARFLSASLLTAIVDYLIFFLVYNQSHSVFVGTATARGVATFVSFGLAYRLVFCSRQSIASVFFPFILLVCCLGTASSFLTSFLLESLHLNIFFAKLFAEGLLYLGNFAVQREFIFRARSSDVQTK